MTTAAAAEPLTDPNANPSVRTEGLGDLVRAYRTYMGVSRKGMAVLMGMTHEVNYTRIEDDKKPCPVGFIDKLDALAEKFDQEVKAIIDAAERHVGGHRYIDGTLLMETPTDEWEKLVFLRAVIESTAITPVRKGIVVKPYVPPPAEVLAQTQ